MTIQLSVREDLRLANAAEKAGWTLYQRTSGCPIDFTKGDTMVWNAGRTGWQTTTRDPVTGLYPRDARVYGHGFASLRRALENEGGVALHVEDLALDTDPDGNACPRMGPVGESSHHAVQHLRRFPVDQLDDKTCLTLKRELEETLSNDAKIRAAQTPERRAVWDLAMARHHAEMLVALDQIDRRLGLTDGQNVSVDGEGGDPPSPAPS